MVKRTIAAALAALALAACGGGGNADRAEADGNYKYIEITLPDGRVLECVADEEYYQGGVTCNWGAPLRGPA